MVNELLERAELSSTNSVRKISSLVVNKTGKFHLYTLIEQVGIIDNYMQALQNVFPLYFEADEPLFYQTVGFGALINVLPTVFDLTMKYYSTFKVEDVIKILKQIDDFSFEDWKKVGTGSAAETQAGEDLRTTLLLRLEEQGSTGSIILK